MWSPVAAERPERPGRSVARLHPPSLQVAADGCQLCRTSGDRPRLVQLLLLAVEVALKDDGDGLGQRRQVLRWSGEALAVAGHLASVGGKKHAQVGE